MLTSVYATAIQLRLGKIKIEAKVSRKVLHFQILNNNFLKKIFLK